MDSDAQYLRLLSIFHYIVGGIAAFFGCFPLIYVGFGIAIVSGAFESQSERPPPEIVGWLMIAFAFVFIVLVWVFAMCVAFAGRSIAARRRYWYCFVMACIECCFSPFGTVLGVFTVIVLLRPSVKTLFGLPAEVPAASPQ